MCPPANSPLSEISLYWSDEQIFAFLNEHVPESHLPSNVIADLSPYKYPPSNLPEGIWYLVHACDNKESEYGFWKAKNEPCKVYSNSGITGWRTTLEYIKAPHGQRTDWLMQEYSITQKEELCDMDKLEESRLLCRVFLSSGLSLNSKMNGKTSTESKKINPVESIDPNINIISGKESRIESQATRVSNTAAVTKPTDENSNSWPPVLSVQECFKRGDFLELDDLDNSNSSSSQNSSCPSNVSDDCFDSLALLREIEDEHKMNQSTRSSSRYNFAASVRPDDVVLQPSSACMSRTIELVEGSQTGSTEKKVQEHIPERHISDNKNEGTSTPSTSRKNPVSSRRKKASSDRIKKLKLFFCFTQL